MLLPIYPIPAHMAYTASPPSRLCPWSDRTPDAAEDITAAQFYCSSHFENDKDCLEEWRDLLHRGFVAESEVGQHTDWEAWARGRPDWMGGFSDDAGICRVATKQKQFIHILDPRNRAEGRPDCRSVLSGLPLSRHWPATSPPLACH